MSKRLDLAGERTDRLEPIRFGATPIKVTPEGFKHYRGTATIGDVILPYANPTRLEFRPADEVLSDEAIESMIGKPITNNHPDDLLSADEHEEVKRRTEGVVITAKRGTTAKGKPAMLVEVVAYTKPLQDLIESGKVELSPGYNTRPDPNYETIDEIRVVGMHDGSPYHVVQRDVTYNHLAVVDRARTRTPAGEVARLDEDDMKTKDKPGEAQAADAKNSNTAGDARTDAERKDMDLSAEAMEKLAELPEADREYIMGCLKMAKEAEGESEADAAGEEMEDADMSEMDMLRKDIAALKDMMSGMGKRADAAPAGRPHFDAAEVIAKAQASAVKSADAHTAMLMKDIEAVRANSPARLDGYDQASIFAAMLAEISEVTPAYKGAAERAIKGGRLDDVRDLYQAAGEVKRQRRNDAQDNEIASHVFGDDGKVTTFTLPKGA